MTIPDHVTNPYLYCLKRATRFRVKALITSNHPDAPYGDVVRRGLIETLEQSAKRWQKEAQKHKPSKPIEK